jgi:hypothetical protein
MMVVVDNGDGSNMMVVMVTEIFSVFSAMEINSFTGCDVCLT